MCGACGRAAGQGIQKGWPGGAPAAPGLPLQGERGRRGARVQMTHKRTVVLVLRKLQVGNKISARQCIIKKRR